MDVYSREDILEAHLAAIGAEKDLAVVRNRISMENDRETSQQAGAREACHEATAMQEAAGNHLEEDPSNLYIDLRPFMDRAPVTVR